MASNLSQLIQDSLSSTLESLLSKPTKLEQITKAHTSDLKNQCIKVDATFKFESIESSWIFFIPALSATYILNLMMGDDSEATEDIDEDTIDALNEVVSNICGGLSTAINGSAFEDLGAVQFSLEGNEKINGEDFANTENLFRFALSLDEKEVQFFIAFDDDILPYIETITSSETTQIEENVEETDASEEIVESTEEVEEIQESTEEKEKEKVAVVEDIQKEEVEKDDKIKDEIKNQDIKDPENSTNEEEALKENIDDKNIKTSILQKLNFLKVEESLSPEDAKQAKLKKLIILVGILFSTVILVAIILFFMGTFDPVKVEKPVDINITKEENHMVSIKAKMRKKHINFTISKINVKRLNRKLALLTKYEIIEEDEIEKIKAAEKEKQFQEKQKRLEEFAKMNKEESLFTKLKDDTVVLHQNKYIKDGISDGNKSINTEEATKELVLDSFIQIPTLKLKKFQTFIKKAKKFNANLSICKNEQGRTLIFIGPFINKKSRDTIIKTLSKKLQNNAKKVNLTKDDFDKKCKF